MFSNHIYRQLSDRQLIDLSGKDDTKAFDEIYCRYREVLICTAQKQLRCRQKSEDIVQEIFVSFYNRRYEVQISTSLSAYFHQALKYKIMNEARSEKVRHSYQKTVYHSSLNNQRRDFNCTYESKEVMGQITASINLLPNKCREAFLLSREGDFSHKDISQQLGISISTVEKHICKALRSLRYNLSTVL